MCQAAPSYAIAATTAAMLGAGDGSTKCRATGASGGKSLKNGLGFGSYCLVVVSN